MFDRFTAHAHAAVMVAQVKARALKHEYIGTEHILLALIDSPCGLETDVAPWVLKGYHGKLIDAVKALQPGSAPPSHDDQLPFTPMTKRAFELAIKESCRPDLEGPNKLVGTEHLLLGLISEVTCLASIILYKHGFDDIEKIRQMVRMSQDRHNRSDRHNHISTESSMPIPATGPLAPIHDLTCPCCYEPWGNSQGTCDRCGLDVTLAQSNIINWTSSTNESVAIGHGATSTNPNAVLNLGKAVAKDTVYLDAHPDSASGSGCGCDHCVAEDKAILEAFEAARLERLKGKAREVNEAPREVHDTELSANELAAFDIWQQSNAKFDLPPGSGMPGMPDVGNVIADSTRTVEWVPPEFRDFHEPSFLSSLGSLVGNLAQPLARPFRWFLGRPSVADREAFIRERHAAKIKHDNPRIAPEAVDAALAQTDFVGASRWTRKEMQVAYKPIFKQETRRLRRYGWATTLAALLGGIAVFSGCVAGEVRETAAVLVRSLERHEEAIGKLDLYVVERKVAGITSTSMGAVATLTSALKNTAHVATDAARAVQEAAAK